jgi:hypothetical protein
MAINASIILRENSGDCVKPSVQANWPADDAGFAVEALAPEAVAEHRHLPALIGARVKPPGGCANPRNIEEVRTGDDSPDDFTLRACFQI